MKVLIKKILFVSLLVIILLCFSSCKKRQSYRLNLSDNIFYFEAPAPYAYKTVKVYNNFFQRLKKRNLDKLSNLLSDKENVLWIRINFRIPPKLKNKDIGLMIPFLRSADMLWLNDVYIGGYGSFPPYEASAGFAAQTFIFPKKIINQNDSNSIYIKIWPGYIGSCSDRIYLGEQDDILRIAARRTFFTSKIIVTFAALVLLVFFIYFFLFVLMKYSKERRSYLFFALMNLYTIFLLVPFYISEISWLKPAGLSHLSILKLVLCFGAYPTGYFANLFIISYLDYKDSKNKTIIRLIILLSSFVVTLFINSYEALASFMPVACILVILQFLLSIPYIIKVIKNKEQHKILLKLILGISPVVLGIIIDCLLRFILHNSVMYYFSIYGWQFTIFFFIGFLLYHFGHMYTHNIFLKNKLTAFNSDLEKLIVKRTKELSEKNFVLTRGLESVAQVQRNFLPPKHKTFQGWELSTSYTALENNVSGDLYDYYSSGTKLTGLGIFDVSGHGIPAGLMTVLAKGIITQHFLNGIAQSLSISEVLHKINKTYIKEKVNVENYITGLLFRFSDFNSDDICRICFANAGHPAPIYYDSKKDKVIELKPDNPDEQYGIIGIDGLRVSFPPVNFSMAQNDILICFTDGITEAINKESESFGKERVIEILKKYKDENAKTIKNKIILALDDFICGSKLRDDVTIIVLKRVNSKDYLEEI